MIFLPYSRHTVPATSQISAIRYSITAAIPIAAPDPTLVLYLRFLKYLPHLPTGKVNPALLDYVVLVFKIEFHYFLVIKPSSCKSLSLNFNLLFIVLVFFKFENLNI